jgi:hypothetical protein
MKVPRGKTMSERGGPAAWPMMSRDGYNHESGQGDAMADNGQLVLYAAAFGSVADARGALDSIDQLHREKAIGKYDAAVIDQESGKPHIVKRVDRPEYRVIPEWFGGGALPRKELREAATQLTANNAGLLVVGEPTIQRAVEKTLTSASNVVKHEVDATVDEITSELQEALKS